MNGLEITGLILFLITFLLCCFLFSRMERVKTKKKRYKFFFTIVGLILVNLTSICFFIYKEFGSNSWSRGSTILLGISIIFLEWSFVILYWRYSSSKQFKYIGVLLISIFCLHWSLELANVNSLNHKIEELKNELQQSKDSEELKSLEEEREKIHGWSITSNILSHSFQTFTLDLDYTGTFIENGYLSSTCKKSVRVLGLLLTILAPVAGGFVLLSIVSNILPVVKLYLVCLVPLKKKIYIFSKLNEYSIITAESIMNEKYRYKPVIIFTNVYTEKSKEISSELLERAKKIGAICLSTDITFLNLRKAFLKWFPPVFKKNFIFLLMDEEDPNNLKIAIDLLAVESTPESKTLIEQNIIGKFNKKRIVEIYIFASKLPQGNERLEKAIEILNHQNKENKKFRKPICDIVNEYRGIAFKLISSISNPYSLYNVEREINRNSSDKSLEIILLGVGRIGIEFIKIAYMFNKLIKVKIFSKDANEKKDFLKSLLKMNDSLFDSIFEFIQGDFTNYEYRDNLYNIISRNIPNYILVALGNDILNIEAKKWIEQFISSFFKNKKRNNKKTFIPLSINFVVEDEKLGLVYKQTKDFYILNPTASLQMRYDINNIQYRFYGYNNEEEIEIPEGVTSIGESSFSNCLNLKKIVIPKSVSYIKDCAFYKCKNLRKIEIPKKVTNIGVRSFFDCENLQFIAMPLKIKNIGDYAYAGCINLKFICLPRGLLRIKSYMFWNCQNLPNIDIPKGVKLIERKAFFNCLKLKKIEIPNSISCIDTDAFEQCTALEYNEYQNGQYLGNKNNKYLVLMKLVNNKTRFNFINTKTKIIYQYAFKEYSGSEIIEIPDSIISIGAYAFYNCKRLEIKMSNNILKIGKHAFSESNVTNIILGKRIQEIQEYAFFACKELSKIIIPNKLKRIGDCAFSDCTSLEEIILGKRVQEIGDYAFAECSSLSNIEVPNKVKKVGSHAFSNCISLEEIILGKRVQEIGDYAFAECSGLSNIEVPNKVKKVGSHAFSNCISLEEITLGEKVQEIGDYAFAGCSSLSNIEVPNKVKKVGSHAFSNCISLEEITLGEEVQEIGDYAFAGCGSLSKIIIPNGIVKIGSYAFSHCHQQIFKRGCYGLYLGNNTNEFLVLIKVKSNVEKFEVPKQTKIILRSAFFECADLIEIIYYGNMDDWSKLDIHMSNEHCVIHCVDGDI